MSKFYYYQSSVGNSVKVGVYIFFTREKEREMQQVAK